MMIIRKALPADAEAIADFQLKMARETENIDLDRSIVEKGVAAVFSDDVKGAYYVAEVDGSVVSSLLTTYEWSDWRNGRVLWIQSVYVSEKYRRRGIYRQMYEHIKTLVQQDETDFRGIRLYVDKTNSHAQQVYAKLGMVNHHYEMYEWMIE
jgi:ribosomal protein S18 acetylase RimI-like enzyme